MLIAVVKRLPHCFPMHVWQVPRALKGILYQVFVPAHIQGRSDSRWIYSICVPFRKSSNSSLKWSLPISPFLLNFKSKHKKFTLHNEAIILIHFIINFIGKGLPQQPFAKRKVNDGLTHFVLLLSLCLSICLYTLVYSKSEITNCYDSQKTYSNHKRYTCVIIKPHTD